MKCHERKCGNSKEEMIRYFQILASETAAWRVSSWNELGSLFWISCPHRHGQESIGPADVYKQLYLLQKSRGLLGIRTNKRYCCLSTYILYVTYVLCTSYVLLIVKGTKEIACQIFWCYYILSVFCGSVVVLLL